MPSSRESSQPRDQTQVSCIAGWFFTVWTTEKSKNIEVGSLFLLQGNFPTQESNWSLLHCRRILYQLSYPGNPDKNLQILYHIFWTKSKAFQILKKRNGFVDSLFHHYSKVGHRMLLFPPKTLVLVLLSFSIIKSIWLFTSSPFKVMIVVTVVLPKRL